MKFDNSKDLVETLTAGMHRFLGESGPYWSKVAIEKLVSPLSIDDKIVSDALKMLVESGDIYLVKDEECYFLISEKLIEASFGPGHRFGIIANEEVQKMKMKYGIK